MSQLPTKSALLCRALALALAPTATQAAPLEPALPGTSHYGAVLGTSTDGERFRCSGTSVNARNLSLVITAGHCVYDEGQWAARRWVFVPATATANGPSGASPLTGSAPLPAGAIAKTSRCGPPCI